MAEQGDIVGIMVTLEIPGEQSLFLMLFVKVPTNVSDQAGMSAGCWK
jgi:hypothetical protein